MQQGFWRNRCPEEMGERGLGVKRTGVIVGNFEKIHFQDQGPRLCFVGVAKR